MSRSGLIRICKFVSAVFSPFIVLPIVSGFLIYSVSESLDSFWHYYSVLGLIMYLPLVVLVFALYKSGYISTLHLKDKNSRTYFYLSSLLLAIITFLMDTLLDFPAKVTLISVLLIVFSAISIPLNLFVKFSLHTLVFCFAGVALGFTYGPWLGTALFILGVLVGMCRIPQGAHSLRQVLAGCFYGLVLGYLYFYLNSTIAVL